MRWEKEDSDLGLEGSLYRRKGKIILYFFIKLLRDKGEISYYIN